MPEEKTPANAPASKRPIEDQILVRAPFLVDRLSARVARLEPETPLRRRILLRALQRGFDALGRQDIEFVLLGYEPDVEIHNFGATGIGLDDRYDGHQGYRDWVGDVFDIWAEPHWTVTRMRDGGDRRVAEIALSAQGKGSGVPVELRWGTVYHASPRGRIARQDAFYQDGWKSALEAAGL